MIKTIATIKHSDSRRTDRVTIGHDTDAQRIVSRATGEAWQNADCGDASSPEQAIAAAQSAWSGIEWDLQLSD